MRTRPAREDSDQLVDALRTIDDLEDKLAGALLAGEALQRQCDASSKPVECDADLVRARDEALDRIASLESALSCQKPSATPPRRLCQTGSRRRGRSTSGCWTPRAAATR